MTSYPMAGKTDGETVETRERAKAERRGRMGRGLVDDAAFIDEASVYFPGEGYRKVTLPPMGELKE